VRVQILNCPVVEPAETFTFNLSAPVNGSIADATGVTTICDDDGPVSLCSIAVTPPNPSIAVGANQQFTATATYTDATTADVTGTATWASANTGVATIGSGGLAHGLIPGTSTISATQSGITGSTVLTVTGLAAQTITFGPLANKTYGDPDFAVGATASSGLPVSFSAAGSCTIGGATVHITGGGSCTITASQPGNASFAPAAAVSQTFSIGKAGQTITFFPLVSKRLGDPDFTVLASASSGLAVAFAASGSCTVNGALVHLSGLGSCTITASQAGNASYAAAPSVARTFFITRRTQPIRCKVPRVIGKTLPAAKKTLARAHCRTGRITRTFSRTRRKGVVVGQSRRPGQVLAANTKVNLVVSRGRKR
jgi:Bacterial Ig-like domain (group 2)/PASTA domain